VLRRHRGKRCYKRHVGTAGQWYRGSGQGGWRRFEGAFEKLTGAQTLPGPRPSRHRRALPPRWARLDLGPGRRRSIIPPLQPSWPPTMRYVRELHTRSAGVSWSSDLESFQELTRKQNRSRHHEGKPGPIHGPVHLGGYPTRGTSTRFLDLSQRHKNSGDRRRLPGRTWGEWARTQSRNLGSGRLLQFSGQQETSIPAKAGAVAHQRRSVLPRPVRLFTTRARAGKLEGPGLPTQPPAASNPAPRRNSRGGILSAQMTRVGRAVPIAANENGKYLDENCWAEIPGIKPAKTL